MTGGDRTNTVEAAHQALYSVLSGNHLHLWSFIQMLKSTQNFCDLSMEHIVSGIKPAGKQLNYKQADDRLHRLVSNFSDSSNIFKFLKGIFHKFVLE